MVVGSKVAARSTDRPGRRAVLGSPWVRRLIGVAALAICAVAVVGAVFYASLPSVADAPARVAAIDRRAGTYSVFVPVNARVARAIVAVEDERFYHHGAIDLLSIARALRTSLTGSVDPGGSTITQQLAKVLYVHQPETVGGRLRAIGLAMKLERRYSKAQILNMYLNAIYFGHGYYGVAAASLGYFGKPVGALSWSQAALLAGLPQAPSQFDPYLHLNRARVRQHEVLAQLVANHAIARASARSIGGSPLRLAQDRQRPRAQTRAR